MLPVLPVPVLPVIAIALGTGLMVASRLLRRREQEQDLVAVLGGARRPAHEPAAPEVDKPEPAAVTRRAIDLVGHAVERLDRRGSLGDALARARIPLRPGEYVIVTAAAGLALAALALALTSSPVLAAAGLGGAPAGARFFVRRRIKKRRAAFEAQLPGALSLVASSLSAGHTFLRAIQMMCEESQPPLAEEFQRVVAETQLGDPVVEALGRMAERLKIRDVDWVVQAIRIQQTVGGKLAELLHTLADFIRAREEVHREVQVLTAEGRVSAYVLGGMVPLLAVAIQVVNPGYVAPLFHGAGLIALVLSGVSVVIGTAVIFRMAKIDV